jgi:hypothetical protein
MLSFVPLAAPKPEPAEMLAHRALGFLTRQRSALDRFLEQSGLRPYDLGRSPIPPEHLAAALDFLITNEPILVKFAEFVDLPLEAIYDARRAVGRVHGAGI